MIKLLDIPQLTAPSNYHSLLDPESLLEQQLQEQLGVPFVVLTNSGTSAIHLALILNDVKENDVVITSTSSFIASVHPVLYQKATPVFVDINGDNWQIDEIALEQAILDQESQGKNIKAVIVPNNYGHPNAFSWKNRLLGKRNIPLIEDNAAGLGSKIEGFNAGTIGDIGVLSFNSNKIVTGLGGGALLLRDYDQYIKAKSLIQHGRTLDNVEKHHVLGYNYRIPPFSVVAILEQLTELPISLHKKYCVFEQYRHRLETQGFEFQAFNDDAQPNHWLITVMHPQWTKEKTALIQERLQGEQIETRNTWFPLHLQEHLKEYSYYGANNALDLYNKGLSLPSSPLLSENDINDICAHLITLNEIL